MVKVDIPQIEVSQEQGTVIQRQYLGHFPFSEIYGRIGLKTLEYAARHHFINKLIGEVYIEHALGKAIRDEGKFFYYDLSHFTYKINIESVIYWLRKNCDDVISLLFYAEYWVKNKTYPAAITIDSIGRLLNTKPPPDFKESIQAHLEFLKLLNDISNAFKHSFVSSNEAAHLIGIDQPSVVAFQMKNNDSKNEIVPHSYSLTFIIKSYSSFFEDVATVFSKTRFREEH